MAHKFEETTKFDDVFMGMLQHCGKIEPFLNVVFSFLSRRTDFFHLMHKKDDKLGFAPGVAEKMLIKIFERYQERVLRNDPIYMKWKQNQENKDGNNKSPNTENEIKQNDNTANNSSTSNVEEGSSVRTCSDAAADLNHQTVAKEVEIDTTAEKTSTDVKKEKTVEDKVNESDSHNGGKTDKYSWSQSLTDVDIKIPIPAFIKASKELSIKIESYSLTVSLKKDPPSESGFESRVILAGKLQEKIRCDESLWSLIPDECIAINLEKFEHKWWDGLIQGDDKIDKQSIDTTQQVHDFDDQTQSDIRKVMYDQQQKMMGKPTSDEQKTHNMLEKAWDAEGSPFKGTPFNPSRVNMSGSGS